MLLNTNMDIRKKITLCLAFLISFSIISMASRNTLGKNEKLPNALITSIDQYYQAEKKGDWETVYNLRVKHFRELIEFKNYQRIMNRDSEGWLLLEYKILNGYQEEDGKYYVDIKILDKPPKTQKILNKTIGVVESVEKTIWLLEGNKWKTQTPGTRGYLSLNEGMNVSINDPVVPSQYTDTEYQSNKDLKENLTNMESEKSTMDKNLSDKVNVGQFNF